MLSACSTTQSPLVIPAPKIEIKKVVVPPPLVVVTPCKKLLQYVSDDIREVIKTAIKNHNRYFLCASKMNAAINYIKK